MKLRRLFFTILLLLAAFQFCFSQEKPKAELISVFGKVTNDELLAQIDNFIYNVSKTNSKGYIILYGEGNEELSKYLFERKIKGCFQGRRYSDENFAFDFAERKKEFVIELWKLANNAEKPLIAKTNRDFTLSNLTRPVLIYENSGTDEYCPLSFDLEFYSRFLKANPNIFGKIVIHTKTLKAYRKIKHQYSKDLSGINKIPQSQLVFVKAKYTFEGNVEFWLAPKKQK